MNFGFRRVNFVTDIGQYQTSTHIIYLQYYLLTNTKGLKTKLRGLSPRADYTDRAKDRDDNLRGTFHVHKIIKWK